MTTEETPEETTVSDRGMVTIPASFRQRLDIEPGDTLRWTVDDEGSLEIAIVRQRYGAFEGFEPVPMGGDGGETHDLAGYEAASEFSQAR